MSMSRVVRRAGWEPVYLALERSGELADRSRQLYRIFRACRLCPRACGVNRLTGRHGICGVTSRVRIAAAQPHYGEERPLVGAGGSGTIFFSGCSLLCEYCQNWNISHYGEGEALSDAGLAQVMLRLQAAGCHNINLVTPTHYVPNIVHALGTAIRGGLRIPLVYNCGGYEELDTLHLLDGIIDIYMPDFKYASGAVAAEYSHGALDYPEVARAALREMHRQVGPLVMDENGVALRGLIVRHLVLPENQAGTAGVARFLAREIGRGVYVNIMGQYRPEFHARNFPLLGRRVLPSECAAALSAARAAGLTNLDRG